MEYNKNNLLINAGVFLGAGIFSSLITYLIMSKESFIKPKENTIQSLTYSLDEFLNREKDLDLEIPKTPLQEVEKEVKKNEPEKVDKDEKKEKPKKTPPKKEVKKKEKNENENQNGTEKENKNTYEDTYEDTYEGG